MLAFIRRIPTWLCFIVGAVLVLARLIESENSRGWYKPDPVPTSIQIRLLIELCVGVILVAIALVRWIILAIKEGPPKHNRNPAS
jgi:hypothetical protein